MSAADKDRIGNVLSATGAPNTVFDLWLGEHRMASQRAATARLIFATWALDAATAILVFATIALVIATATHGG